MVANSEASTSMVGDETLITAIRRGISNAEEKLAAFNR
jgi:hypothetical protein